jgi:hypothetical protein
MLDISHEPLRKKQSMRLPQNWVWEVHDVNSVQIVRARNDGTQ